MSHIRSPDEELILLNTCKQPKYLEYEALTKQLTYMYRDAI